MCIPVKWTSATVTVYVSVGALFHLTIADHIDSCTDSLVQLCHVLRTQNTLWCKNSLSPTSTVKFSSLMSYALLIYKKGKLTCVYAMCLYLQQQLPKCWLSHNVNLIWTWWQKYHPTHELCNFLSVLISTDRTPLTATIRGCWNYVQQ